MPNKPEVTIPEPHTGDMQFDKMAHEQVLAVCRGAAARCSEQHAYMRGAKEDTKNWFPHKWVIDAMRGLIGINQSTCFELRAEVTRLTAELAKTRELLRSVHTGDLFGPEDWEKVRNFLNREDPKACQCGLLRNITEGGHFPACTRCHRRLKP